VTEVAEREKREAVKNKKGKKIKVYSQSCSTCKLVKHDMSAAWSRRAKLDKGVVVLGHAADQTLLAFASAAGLATIPRHVWSNWSRRVTC
jgi:formylmethanofuran dehydrogenase subunit D